MKDGDKAGKARKISKLAGAKRVARRKAVRQTFYLNAVFRDEDEFDAGREAIFTSLCNSERIEIISELTDYRHGKMQICVEATVEDMLEVKKELSTWPLRITGGEL